MRKIRVLALVFAAILVVGMCVGCASNNDITDVFVDSALKICGNDLPSFVKFVKEVDKLSAVAGYSCVMTVSATVEDCMPDLREYM